MNGRRSINRKRHQRNRLIHESLEPRMMLTAVNEPPVFQVAGSPLLNLLDAGPAPKLQIGREITAKFKAIDRDSTASLTYTYQFKYPGAATWSSTPVPSWGFETDTFSGPGTDQHSGIVTFAWRPPDPPVGNPNAVLGNYGFRVIAHDNHATDPQSTTFEFYVDVVAASRLVHIVGATTDTPEAIAVRHEGNQGTQVVIDLNFDDPDAVQSITVPNGSFEMLAPGSNPHGQVTLNLPGSGGVAAPGLRRFELTITSKNDYGGRYTQTRPITVEVSASGSSADFAYDAAVPVAYDTSSGHWFAYFPEPVDTLSGSNMTLTHVDVNGVANTLTSRIELSKFDGDELEVDYTIDGTTATLTLFKPFSIVGVTTLEPTQEATSTCTCTCVCTIEGNLHQSQDYAATRATLPAGAAGEILVRSTVGDHDLSLPLAHTRIKLSPHWADYRFADSRHFNVDVTIGIEQVDNPQELAASTTTTFNIADTYFYGNDVVDLIIPMEFGQLPTNQYRFAVDVLLKSSPNEGTEHPYFREVRSQQASGDDLLVTPDISHERVGFGPGATFSGVDRVMLPDTYGLQAIYWRRDDGHLFRFSDVGSHADLAFNPLGDITGTVLTRETIGSTSYVVLTDKWGTKSYYHDISATPDIRGTLLQRIDRWGNKADYSYIDFNGDGFRYEIDTITRTPLAPLSSSTIGFDYYSEAVGHRVVITDPVGRTTEITVDVDADTTAAWSVIARLPDPDSATGTYSSATATWEVHGTGLGGLTLLNPQEGGGHRSTQYLLDFAHERVLMTHNDGSTAWLQFSQPLSRPFVFDTPLLGNDVGGAIPRFADKREGRYVDTLGNATRFGVDDNGFVVYQIDPLGGRFDFGRNAAGQTTWITTPVLPEHGRLTTVNQYSTDGRYLLTETTSPDGGVERWQYDAFSQPTSYEDPVGRMTYLDRDPANGNLLQLRQDPTTFGGSDEAIWKFTYYASGLTRSVQDPLHSSGSTASVYYTYDGLGNVAFERFLANVGSGNLLSHPLAGQRQYTYDSFGLPTGVADEAGKGVGLEYDKLGRLRKQTVAPGPGLDSISTVFTYTPVGNLWSTKTTKLGAGPNDPARTVDYSYDHRNRVSSIDWNESLTRGSWNGVSLNDAKLTLGFFYDTQHNLLRETVEDGQQSQVLTETTHEYNALGYRTKTTLPDPDGASGPQASPTHLFGVDSMGRLTTHTDPLENTIGFEYDRGHRVDHLSGPNGWSESFSYNAAGDLLGYTDAAGKTTNYEYDLMGRLTKIIDPLLAGKPSRGQSLLTYDRASNLTTHTDPLLRVTDYTYNDRRWLEETVLPDPDLSDGSSQRPRTTFDYFSNGQTKTKTQVISNSGTSRTTTYVYDGAARLTSVTYPATAAETATEQFKYDLFGNLIRYTDPEGRETDYEFDQLDRLHRVIEPDPTTDGGAQRPVTVSLYDLRGRLVRQQDAEARSTVWHYDDLDRVTYEILPDPTSGAAYTSSTLPPVGNDWQYSHSTYDAAGNLTQHTDRAGLGKSNTYDLYGGVYRLTTISDLQATGTTELDYNSQGRRTSLTDAVGNLTTWQYNALGLVDNETTAIPNSAGTGTINVSRSFEYDLAGNVTRTTDRNGRIIDYGYNRLNRRTSETWKTSGGSTVHSLDFDYDLAGRLIETSDIDHSETFSYDLLDRLTTRTSQISGLTPSLTVAAEYSLTGTRTNVTGSVGGTTDFVNVLSYDRLDRLTRLEQTGSSVAAKQVDFDYDQTGRVTTLQRANTTWSGTSAAFSVSQFQYDGTGRLTSLHHVRGTNPADWSDPAKRLAGYDFAYDNSGRLTQLTNALFAEESVSYGYDERGQVTSADYTDTTSGAQVADEDYDYDANGNRLFDGGEVVANNRLRRDSRYEYEYDAEGNRTRRIELEGPAGSQTATGPTTDYAWDHRNRLVSVTERPTPSGAATKVVEFTYNAANEQIARAVHLDGNSGTAPDESRYFGYDQGQIIWQFEGSSASDLSHRYLWGPAVDQILADEKLTTPGQAGIVDWALTDQLGSVRDVVRVENGQAKVVKHRAYDAFGNLRGDLNHDGNVDLDDINLLLAAINNGTTDELFDLNGDGVVDNLTDGDLDQLILYIVKTYYGDANLDGQFDSSDMTLVFLAGEYEDGDNDNSTWEEGDWTGDGDFDSADYIVAMLSGMYEAGPNPDFSHPDIEFLFGYTARLYDDQTQLQNNLHRWYDPQTGGWLSQDPIGFAAGDANLYRYVGNKTTGYVDPNGLEERPWYNNDWTDLANPFAYIASHGASLGDRIGDGFSQGDRVELVLRAARARQEGLVNRIAYGSSNSCDDLSGATRSRELGGILGRGLLDVGDSAAKTADAYVASAELAADVVLTVQLGSSTLGAVRSTSGIGMTPLRVSEWGSASKLANNLSTRNWRASSIEKAITRHAGENYTTWVTKTGKRIYENPATGRQVVHDLEGGYFRIFQPDCIGSQKGTYLNMLGNELRPARIGRNGVNNPLLRDVDKTTWQQETHFFIEELLNGLR